MEQFTSMNEQDHRQEQRTVKGIVKVEKDKGTERQDPDKLKCESELFLWQTSKTHQIHKRCGQMFQQSYFVDECKKGLESNDAGHNTSRRELQISVQIVPDCKQNQTADDASDLFESKWMKHFALTKTNLPDFVHPHCDIVHCASTKRNLVNT